jgi:hypothetical protein
MRNSESSKKHFDERKKNLNDEGMDIDTESAVPQTKKTLQHRNCKNMDDNDFFIVAPISLSRMRIHALR